MRLPELLIVIVMVAAGAVAAPYLVRDLTAKQKSDWWWSGCTDANSALLGEVGNFVKPEELETLARISSAYCNEQADALRKEDK